MSTCISLVGRLQELNSLKFELDQKIHDYFDLEDASSAKIKSVWLMDIFKLRKEILKLEPIRGKIKQFKVNRLIDSDFDQLKFEEAEYILDYFWDKTKDDEALSKKELEYYYKLFLEIEDYRLEELMVLRDIEADMQVIFECGPEQIIHNKSEFDEATQKQIEIKAYVGELFDNFFSLIPDSLERIYTKFPEHQVIRKPIKLGTGFEDGYDFHGEFNKLGIEIDLNAYEIMLESNDLIAKEEKDVNLVILTASDLGFPTGVRFNEIVEEAKKKYGLELCSPEVGLQLWLQYPDQLNRDCLTVAMNPVLADGSLHVFKIKVEDSHPVISTFSRLKILVFGGNSKFVFVLPNKNNM